MHQSFKGWIAIAVLALALGACKTQEEKLRASGVKPRTEQELKQEFVGNTVFGTTEVVGQPRIHYVVYYAAEGNKLYGQGGVSMEAALSAKEELAVDEGTWAIEDGKLCNHWKQWMQKKKLCSFVYKVGEEYRGYNPAGALVLKYWIKPGNPHKIGPARKAP